MRVHIFNHKGLTRIYFLKTLSFSDRSLIPDEEAVYAPPNKKEA